MRSNAVLSVADKAIECDLDNLDKAARLYYIDVGLANYFYELSMRDLSMGNARGGLAENFVFLELDKRDPNYGLFHKNPVFGTYGQGEIDFLEYSKETHCTFAIDVKCGKRSSKTALKLLSDRIADYVLYVRSNTKGGIGDPGILTIPIYLFDRFDFDSNLNPPAQPSLYREKVYEAIEEVKEQKELDAKFWEDD
jgi:predicted AAA+ superfamily ATPase